MWWKNQSGKTRKLFYSRLNMPKIKVDFKIHASLIKKSDFSLVWSHASMLPTKKTILTPPFPSLFLGGWINFPISLQWDIANFKKLRILIMYGRVPIS